MAESTLHNPGKYDDILTEALKQAGAQTGVLMVIQGNKGEGYSVQATLEELILLPGWLRKMADVVEADLVGILAKVRDGGLRR